MLKAMTECKAGSLIILKMRQTLKLNILQCVAAELLDCEGSSDMDKFWKVEELPRRVRWVLQTEELPCFIFGPRNEWN